MKTTTSAYSGSGYNVEIDWLIEYSLTSSEHVSGYITHLCKGHWMGCLWLLPKPNTGGDYWYEILIQKAEREIDTEECDILPSSVPASYPFLLIFHTHMASYPHYSGTGVRNMTLNFTQPTTCELEVSKDISHLPHKTCQLVVSKLPRVGKEGSPIDELVTP